ncbi:MAG: ABC transporter ATP-binding protein [Anaerolineales bacterium]|nr:ABC transporter ATP-binding protein [Anaerolineales bacterium]
MTVPPVVRLTEISKRFHSAAGTSIVLHNVNLTLEPGQKVSLVGPSGSGKSTLLSLIAGLLRPDSGTVEFEGVSLGSLSDDARADLRARRIGIALQSDNLIPFLSAQENVELALGLGRPPAGAAQARHLLDRMGVAHRAGHLPRHLSGGEAQRVALAVALANNPQLLLADEMVAQLDESTAGAVVHDVFETDMTVLFVTHNPALAKRADVQLCLRDRQVAPL